MIPVTGLGGLTPSRAPNILANLNLNKNANTASTVTYEREREPETPAERCERERAELHAITIPEGLTPSMRIQYEIARLERVVADTCRPCDEARAKLAALRAQRPAVAPNVRYGAKKVPGACNYLDRDLRVSVYFMRHSESCANVLKRNTRLGGLAQKGYTDPELSGRGVAMVMERARQLQDELAGFPSPIIVCSSALFRAQQTALYLSNGLREGQTSSNRVIVLPYIQETGIGQENTALSEVERERLGLYSKLPGGMADKERLVTDLFNAAPSASTPNVERFFDWLRCNITAVYKAAASGSAAVSTTDSIQLLVVSHTGTMTEIYKRYTPNATNLTTIKHDNLDGMKVEFSVKASTSVGGGGMSAIRIVAPRIKYTPSVRIPASCPDTTCRKPVCPASASTSTLGSGVAEADPALCNMLGTARSVAIGSGPLTSQQYRDQLKPVVTRLAANSRPQVKTLRRKLAAYEPPGAFMGLFRKGKDRTELSTNVQSAANYFGCSPDASSSGFSGNLNYYKAGGARRTRKHRK